MSFQYFSPVIFSFLAKPFIKLISVHDVFRVFEIDRESFSIGPYDLGFFDLVHHNIWIEAKGLVDGFRHDTCALNRFANGVVLFKQGHVMALGKFQGGHASRRACSDDRNHRVLERRVV